MASNETVELNAPHTPQPNALQAFGHVLDDIKEAIISSRRDWNKHEPRMWKRASGLDDSQLVAFDLANDLVLIRAGPTSYGQILFGKIRIPAINDDQGEGFVHVRIHDSPGEGTSNVKFHSILTEEKTWTAIQAESVPLEFFSE